jgi:hypothetical protein
MVNTTKPLRLCLSSLFLFLKVLNQNFNDHEKANHTSHPVDADTFL